MGMTLKELLTKGEGTLSAQEAKALAAQCRMDVDTLYTLLEERGIKVLEEENEPSLDVDSIIAEVENAELPKAARCGEFSSERPCSGNTF